MNVNNYKILILKERVCTKKIKNIYLKYKFRI
jgi:hypothetical protein